MAHLFKYCRCERELCKSWACEGEHELSDAEWNLIERWLVERLFCLAASLSPLGHPLGVLRRKLLWHGAPRLHANLAEVFISVYSQRSATMGFRAPVWPKGFSEIRVLDFETFQRVSEYIRNNPIRRRIASAASEFPHSPPHPGSEPDPAPQGLKPIAVVSLGGIAKAMP